MLSRPVVRRAPVARRARACARALAVVALLVVAACTSDTDTPERDDAAPAVEARNPDCPAAVDDALTDWEQAGFSGTVVVTGPDGPTCAAAYGVADRAAGRATTVDTVFSIGSVSKAVTAAAVLSLVDDGALALDDRAGALVADLTGPVADATVEQLLLHTSGLEGDVGADHQPLTRDDAVAALNRLDLAFPPGTDSLYSNAGYVLLALVAETVTGEPWRDVVVERALTGPDGPVGGFWDGEPAPSGPRAVGYLDDGAEGEDGSFAGPHWALAGNGDIAMTMPELAAWTRRLFTGDLLSPGSTERVATPGVETGPGEGESAGWAVLDDEPFGEPVVAAAGGGGDVGHEVVVAWLPGSEQVVAVATNTVAVTAEGLLQTVGPALVTGEDLPRPEGPTAAGPTAEERAALVGTYALDSGGAVVIADDDGELVARAEGVDAVSALFPLPDGVSAAEAEAHGAAVLALLQGESAAGREEREALEGDIGPLDAIEPAGTLVEDGELRSYVVLVSGDEEVPVWYALDGDRAIAAVEITDHLPTVALDALGDGTFRPHDPTGAGPEVTLTFAGDDLTIGGPTGPVTARRA